METCGYYLKGFENFSFIYPKLQKHFVMNSLKLLAPSNIYLTRIF